MFRVIVCLAALMCVQSSYATTTFIANAYIQTVRAFADTQGLCSAQVDVDVNTAGSRNLTGCAERFISFGCDGEYISKAAANAMFSSAQLAKVTGARVSLYVDDTRQYNINNGEGTCLATVVVVN